MTDQSEQALNELLKTLPPESQSFHRRTMVEFAIAAVEYEQFALAEKAWADGRAARLAAGPQGETPQVLAESVVQLLCDDPDVWFHFGLPGGDKLAVIEQRIVQAIQVAIGTTNAG